MGATCAVCLRPIVTRHDVRVFETEVMHTSCAASGQETVGWRHKRELAQLRADLVRANEEMRRKSALAARAQEESAQLLRTANGYASSVALGLEQARVERAQAEVARDTAVRERDTLRAQIAKSTAGPSTAPEEYGKDAETRFALLELDPL